MQHLKMDLFDDVSSALGGGVVTSVASMVPQMIGGYMNMRNTNERLDRQEAQAWDMYQQERADAKSAVQDRVADLKKAGLNPILAASGQGASVASGAASSGVAGQMVMPDLMGFMTTLKSLEQKDKEIGLQNKRLELDALNSIPERELKRAQGYNEKYGIQSLISDFVKGLKNQDKSNMSVNDLIRLMRAGTSIIGAEKNMP